MNPQLTGEQLMNAVPEGFGSVTPYLFVADAESFIAFLTGGLGGREVMRSLRPDGKIANAHVALGTSTVMVSDMPYGDRQGGVRDPHSNIWWISQRLVSGSYKE